LPVKKQQLAQYIKIKNMSRKITTPFQVTSWDAVPYDEIPDSPTLSRVAVKKTFDGELKGESTAELLMCASEDSSVGYTVLERVVGELSGRTQRDKRQC
jgi:hypothetical protein